MGTIFVAGVYGVGKSTLCESLSLKLNIPAFSAGDLISRVNGEVYGANKAVKDKNYNQIVLEHEIHRILVNQSRILLAGHFNIFDREQNVIMLPVGVFKQLQIDLILLLESECEQIWENLKKRDNSVYRIESIRKLIDSERLVAGRVAEDICKPLVVHKMSFNGNDAVACYNSIASYLTDFRG